MCRRSATARRREEDGKAIPLETRSAWVRDTGARRIARGRGVSPDTQSMTRSSHRVWTLEHTWCPKNGCLSSRLPTWQNVFQSSTSESVLTEYHGVVEGSPGEERRRFFHRQSSERLRTP